MSEEVVLLVAIGEPRAETKALSVKAESEDTPVRNKQFSGAIVPDGGVGPFTYSQPGGGLPPGVSFNAADGTLSGSPTTQGHYEFQIDVTDAESNTISTVYSMKVEGGIVWETKRLPDAEYHVPYSAELNVSGGRPPYTFTVSGGTFPFAQLNSGGTGSGSIVDPLPLTTPVPERRQFTLRATDLDGNYADQAFSIILWPPPQWLTSPHSDGLVNLPFEQRLEFRYGNEFVFDSERPTPNFSISGGALPPGLAISPTTGTIYGTPSASGLYNYTVRMVDDLGGFASVPMQSRIAAVTDIDQIYETTFGDGGSNDYLILHLLGATPRSVVVYDKSGDPPWPTVDVEWSVVDLDTISVTTAVVPNPSQYTITITG